jgi:hypothetical protein
VYARSADHTLRRPRRSPRRCQRLELRPHRIGVGAERAALARNLNAICTGAESGAVMPAALSSAAQRIVRPRESICRTIRPDASPMVRYENGARRPAFDSVFFWAPSAGTTTRDSAVASNVPRMIAFLISPPGSR